MPTELIVPSSMESLIASLDNGGAPLAIDTIARAVNEARGKLEKPSAEENLGAWGEVLAFALYPMQGQSSPWNTYFGPVSSGDREDGTRVYFPDIAGTPANVVEHWKRRANSVCHPVLKARYADLAWDMARAIANADPDPCMARTAIGAYLASLDRQLLEGVHDRFNASLRALDLAVMLRDAGGIDAARASLLKLHAAAVAEMKGLWWIAFDRLIVDKRAALTDVERNQLVSDLEAIISRCAATTDPSQFNPHATKDAADRLIKHYSKLGRGDEVKRLNQAIARSFEHFASLGDAMVASSALQTAVNAYHNAGLPDESRRARVLMEEKIAQSRDELKPIVVEHTITREDMEKFLAQVVSGNVGSALARIASEFLQSRTAVEKQVQELVEQAPLMATITQSIMAERHVAAKIGSVTDDPFGRLVQNAARLKSMEDVWLINALARAIQVYELTPGHIAGWAARTGLYDDLSLLLEGIAAWFDQDYVKAVHVLVPQVEAGLRGIVGKLGKPMTKRHPTIQGVGVAINMGDILYNAEITDALGSDITLHFLALYADPRGFNLRNDVAHGLDSAEQYHLAVASRVIHTLLVLGIWDKLAEARKARSTSDVNPDPPIGRMSG